MRALLRTHHHAGGVHGVDVRRCVVGIRIRRIVGCGASSSQRDGQAHWRIPEDDNPTGSSSGSGSDVRRRLLSESVGSSTWGGRSTSAEEGRDGLLDIADGNGAGAWPASEGAERVGAARNGDRIDRRLSRWRQGGAKGGAT